jgi:hypothetical protein
LDFENYGIPFHNEVFTICLRSKQDKKELHSLKDEYLEFIWPCLSQKQKTRFGK